jgi:molybdopterin synthase catalytic subunit
MKFQKNDSHSISSIQTSQTSQTGQTGKPMIEIVTETIDVDRVLESVRHPAAGAIDLFIGTTRDHSRGRKVIALEYEAYGPMALNLMIQIGEQAKARWNVQNVAIVHRLGRLMIGEASIVIAVSSGHRKDAFESCRYIIDTLKQTVPIWKKEFFEDGEVWVGQEGRESPAVQGG